jgi:ribonuclease HII
MLQIRHTNDELLEVGIDEAGRGCFWGPLYAAAVIWSPEVTDAPELKGIRDSKKLSEKKRDLAADYIKEYALSWGVGVVTAAEITELGVTRANQLSFVRALENLSVQPERLLIDGCISIYDAPWSMVPQVVEAEADNKYLPVAAASILAKVGHDDYVKEFCALNTNIAETYDLAKNKGYGTLKHREGILKHGISQEHRPQFLRKLLGEASS